MCDVILYMRVSLSVGLGGNMASGPGTSARSGPSQCSPGMCFNQDMCIPAEGGGFTCAPCPDGYTGDGVHCDDVNEVGGVCVLPGQFNL